MLKWPLQLIFFFKHRTTIATGQGLQNAVCLEPDRYIGIGQNVYSPTDIIDQLI